MPTSTLGVLCGSQEVNFKEEKKTNCVRDKNVKKLQVIVKPPTSDLDADYKSPEICTSAQVLLKPMDTVGYVGHEPCGFSGQFGHHGQLPAIGQRPYGHQDGPHYNEYAAAYQKADSYVDLSRCEKDNERNSQRNTQPAYNYYNGHNMNGIPMSNLRTQHTRAGNGQVPMETNTVPHQNSQCVCPDVQVLRNQRKSKSKLNLKHCCCTFLIVFQFVWMGLFAWLVRDNLRFNYLDDEFDNRPGHFENDHKSPQHSSATMVPEPYQPETPPQVLVPTNTGVAPPPVPLIGIKMEIDPNFITNQGNTVVMWTYSQERHLRGILYHNGSFRVNVTGYYSIQSTLSLSNVDGAVKIRVNHCINVVGKPAMAVCENKELPPYLKAGGSTVQDSMVYLEAGQQVHVTISDLTKIYDSVQQNKFTMYLQRLP